MNCELNLS